MLYIARTRCLYVHIIAKTTIVGNAFVRPLRFVRRKLLKENEETYNEIKTLLYAILGLLNGGHKKWKRENRHWRRFSFTYRS